jgi:hypothetical protein
MSDGDLLIKETTNVENATDQPASEKAAINSSRGLRKTNTSAEE